MYATSTLHCHDVLVNITDLRAKETMKQHDIVNRPKGKVVRTGERLELDS